jgi:predicted secreted Zn-dependent protease
MRKILFACAALILMPAVPAAGEPLVRMHTSYYYIDGPSATVLAAQLDQNGPVGTDGSHYAGRTRWDIQWKFRHEQKGTACSMKDVAVAVGVAQTMPRWRGENKGASGLKTLWTKFIGSLQRHEDGHKEHGLKAGKEIEAAVLAVKPAANCEDLEAAANAAAQAIVAKYQALDTEYDRKTDHGRNQGATLL